MNEEQKNILLKNAGFKCQKCGYYSPLGKDLGVVQNHHAVLCSVCSTFAPAQSAQFQKYLGEYIDGRMLDTFRKFNTKRLDFQKKGMIESARAGNIVTRPAFGYVMQDSQLAPSQNAEEVREIFEAFAKGSSLNSIASTHHLSVNGVKKILKNFTYIGKVKFNNQIMHGKHRPLISSELFNSVQQKFEDIIRTKEGK